MVLKPLAVLRNGQSSIAIKNTSLGITWSEDENKMSSNRF